MVSLCILVLPLAAQNASLTGTVKDQQGGAMPNVSITITSQETGVAMATRTDAGGNYEFPTVKPGILQSTGRAEGIPDFRRKPASCWRWTIECAWIR